MQKNKLHQWLIVILIVSLFSTSCSKKNYAASQEGKDDDTEVYVSNIMESRPQEIIYISDERSKTNRNGEIYFDDENGFRYWKFCDGKYYLDSKYEQNGYTPDKKKKQSKKQSKKKKHNAREAEYQ